MKGGIWTVWLLLLGSSVFGQNVITFDEFMEGVENRTAQEELNLMLEGVEEEEDEESLEVDFELYGEMREAGYSPVGALGLQI